MVFDVFLYVCFCMCVPFAMIVAFTVRSRKKNAGVLDFNNISPVTHADPRQATFLNSKFFVLLFNILFSSTLQIALFFA